VISMAVLVLVVVVMAGSPCFVFSISLEEFLPLLSFD